MSTFWWVVLFAGPAYLALATVQVAKLVRRAKRDRSELKVKEFYEDPKGSNLVKFYKDREGNQWYAFEDLEKLPARRALAADIAANMADMNITREALEGYVLKMREAAEQGNIPELFQDLGRLQDRLTWATEENTLQNVAKCYFVLEGEHPKRPSRKWDEKKQEIWDNDDDCRVFFCQRAYRLINAASKASDTDILTCLMQQRMEQQILPSE